MYVLCAGVASSEVFSLRMSRVVDSRLHAVTLINELHFVLYIIRTCILHLQQVGLFEHLVLDLVNLILDDESLLLLAVQLIIILLVFFRIVGRWHATVDGHGIDN